MQSETTALLGGPDIYEHDVPGLEGGCVSLSVFRGSVALIVNVASRCGLTPQYDGLQSLHRDFGPRGLHVLGVPCNQFGGQEPGSSEEIAQFCSVHYRVSFPLTKKLDVNGPNRHPLYKDLVQTADDEGKAGDVHWNFEKFLIASTGNAVRRFRPEMAPDSPSIVSAIEALLPPP